jgi:FkbM family methyltransferase
MIPNLIHKLAHPLFAGWGRDILSGLPIRPSSDLVELGNPGTSWIVPLSRLRPDSVCCLAGVGLDISFDLELVRRTGCTVHALDPTPRSARFIAGLELPPTYHFHPVGLWGNDTTLSFHAPKQAGYISHSAVNLQGTPVAFEAPCRSLSSLLREWNLPKIDLLKIDIEGAEYEVLSSLERDALLPEILCIEFDETHSPLDGGWKTRIRTALLRLAAQGYILVAHRPFGNVTLIRNPGLS